MGLPERTNEAAGAYAKACVAAAEECGCVVVDLWTKMQQFPDWQKAFLRYFWFIMLVCIELDAGMDMPGFCAYACFT